jgi:hypothetical protein
MRLVLLVEHTSPQIRCVAMSDDPLQDPRFQLEEDPLPAASALPSTELESDTEIDIELKAQVQDLAMHEPATQRLPESVSVINTAEIEGHTLYTIAVQWDADSYWTVSKRFSDIDALHNLVAQKVANLPQLPPKKLLFNRDPEFVNKRKNDIQQYLNELFKIEHITIFPEVQAFFKLNERGVRIKPLGNSVPSPVCKFKDPQFGINSVWFDQKLGIGVSISENGNAISRVDKVILNVKLPWEAKSNAFSYPFIYLSTLGAGVPIGCACVWRRNSKNQWIATVIRK